MAKRPGVDMVILLIAWPVVGYAAPVDIREIGVHVPDLPPGAAIPQVIPRVDGYLAVLQIGSATLTIGRVEEPVPGGSDVREVNYRAAQQAAFHEYVDAKAPGKPTGIGGHPAWTSASRQREWPGRDVTWNCTTYLIVDRHLYRFHVSASGGETRPRDFDAALQVMSDVTFVPVDRSKPQTAGASPSGLLKMPTAHVNMRRDWDDVYLKRRGEPEVIEVEFGIDNKGHVRDLQQTYGASVELGKSARRLIQNATFDVGPSWEANGYDKLRFTWEIQSATVDEGNSCPTQAPHTPGAEVMHICSTSHFAGWR